MTTGILQSQAHPIPVRRHRRRRRHPVPALLALALATGLALTGCTPKDSPPSAGTSLPMAPASSTAPATSRAPTTPPTPIYKPATANGPAVNVPTPVLPAKAKEFSKTGLEEFARYWYATLGYAFETGDAEAMMEVSDPNCKTCAAMKKAVTGGHADGRWIVGGNMIVLTADSSFVKVPDGTYQTVAMVRQQNVKYYRADKSLSKDLGVTVSIADIVVTNYVNGQWVAVTVEHLQGSKGK